MLTDNNFSLAALNNPLNLQQQYLDELSARLGGEAVLVDGNNPFTFLLELFSLTTARFALGAQNDLMAQNDVRSQTSEELYKHMSDFDYVGLFSSPATTLLQMTFDKRYLFANATSFNNNYLKVVIPKETTFTIGKFVFGLYYPIEIQLNKHTGSTLVLYDTSVANPLFDLTQNVLERVEYSYRGMEFLAFKFPIYQFAQAYITETLTPGIGFTKKYKYTDRFYAARLFTEVNGKRIELKQTISDANYDPYVPTARLMIEPELNVLRINVPQVYFSNNQMGSRLFIELYTTKGALDADISTVNPDTIQVNFGTDVSAASEYSKILFRIPTMFPSPVEKKVVGGSNGLSYEELRRRVINNSFHVSALVTPMDLTNYFADYGFTVKKYLDNLTQRIYFGYRTLTDSTGSIIQATHAAIQIYDGIENDVPTMLRNMDGSLTLLPTTLYSYDSTSGSCTPVHNEELNTLAALSREDLVDAINNGVYTRSPFHICLRMEDRYTLATSYNLMNPEIRDFVFEQENNQITAEMSASVGSIVHRKEGTGGYLVRIAVSKSKDVENIPESDLVVYLYTKSTQGNLIGTTATYVGKQGTDAVYQFTLDTDYFLTKDHALNVTSLTDETALWAYPIELVSTFRLAFLVKKSWFPNTTTELSLYEGVPLQYQNDYLCMSRQRFTLDLGHHLEKVILNNVDIQWAGQTYQTYQTTEYYTYPQDEYARDSNGALVYIVENGQVVLDKLHSKGEVILDEQGNPLVMHRAGDIVLDANGRPTVVKDRAKVYFLHLIQLDAKLFLSEHPTHVAYRKQLIAQMETYFDTLRTAGDLLLEQTQLFFRPTRTLGIAKYDIGNDVKLNQSLDLRFKIRCHMPSRVAGDPALVTVVQETIIATIEAAIASTKINMAEIANQIRAKVSDYVYYVDVLGINGNPELQTMALLDTDAQPSLAQKLVLTKDGTLTIEKDVDIEIVVAN